MLEGPESIRDVADTAMWVAYYRAKETDRADAMFRDPLAKLLVGDRGERIARTFGPTGRYAEWTVLSRTVNIDDFITEAVAQGVDAVLNLGAGLDTRPYRLDLPATLLWVEADFAPVVEYKEAKLAAHKPRCQLERRALDLADDTARRSLLSSLVRRAHRILVLTEGVVPYLTEDEVVSLAEDLSAQPRFAFWLLEYFTPAVYPYLKLASHSRKMANAPFRFFPEDWAGFFEKHGWKIQELRFPWHVARRFARQPPMPWFARLMLRFASPEQKLKSAQNAGFMLLHRK